MSTATDHKPSGDKPAGAGAPGGFLGRSRTFSGVSPVQIGVAWLWLSIIVLLPLAAITVQSFDNGWSGFWDAITDDAAIDALRITVGSMDDCRRVLAALDALALEAAA